MQITTEFLRQEYEENNQSIRQIAKQIGKHYEITRKLLIDNGIKLRTSAQAQTKYKDILTKEYLLKEYIENKRSACEIAKEFNISHNNIINYLKKYDIKVRNRKESHKDKHSHNYKGGRPHCKDCGKLIWYYFTRCSRCAKIEQWKDLEYKNRTIKAMRKAMKLSPNKKEKKLRNILNKLFPKEYKFVGKGDVIIDGLIPDFININGKKKIIELYGDYWHRKTTTKLRDKKRTKIYAKYGYNTLIIWESELENEQVLEHKLKEFHYDVINTNT